MIDESTQRAGAVYYQWPMFGHDVAVQFLQQITRSSITQANKLRHAYLLLGMRQVGKSTLATIFAQSLLCTGSTRPCGTCRSCRLFQQGNHPDFRLIQPVDKQGDVDRMGGMLRAEQATDIIHDVLLRPMEGRYKIFLLQDIHTANDSFANKLLKTLEEPPDHALFLLTALDRSRLLPTIVSRCQLLELRPVVPSVIAQVLQSHWHVESTQAELLSRLARGRLGWAVQQIQDEDQQKTRLNHLQLLWNLLAAQPVERLATAEKLASSTQSTQLFELLETWTAWWRDIMLVQTDCAAACCNIDQQSELDRQAASISPPAVRQYLQTIARIEGYLHHTINTRLALEVLVLQLPTTQMT